MAYDYSKILGKIKEVCGTQAVFAEKMGWSEHTCSMKLTNRVAWKQPEIHKAVEILGLEDEDIQAYFFTLKVQKI
jgi:hypothetical protein